MANVVKRNLTVHQGSNFSAFQRFRDTDGNYEDISGSVWNGHFATDFSSSIAGIFGVAINDDSVAEVVIVLTASASAALSAGEFVYDIYQTLPGSRFRRMEGIMTVTPQVTRI